MQEIIEQVLQAEDSAKKRIEASRKRAAEMRAEAEEKANLILSEAREKASAVIQTSLNRSREEAAENLKKAVAEEEARTASFLDSFQDKIEELSGQIVNIVGTAEFKKG